MSKPNLDTLPRQHPHPHSHPHTERELACSRAHRVRKARMGPRNTALLIPARTHPADDSLGAPLGGEERQRDR